MPYQIKSTPFFQRMVSTSKQNGQLRELKNEYERIKNFNTLGTEQMLRQARLERLFKKIEQIKETAGSPRQNTSEKLKSLEEMRMETLLKSKELGKEFSRLNGVTAERLHSPRVAGGGPSTSAAARKELIQKRISYGNARSRYNLAQNSQQRRCSANRNVIEAGIRELNEKKAKLQQRIVYGNTRSSFNLNNMSRQAKRPSKPQVSRLEMQPPENGPTSSQTEVKSWDSVPTTSKKATAHLEPKVHQTLAEIISETSEEGTRGNSRVRVQGLWRKLALLVRHSSDFANRRNQKPLNQLSCSEEFMLRNISNNTNLPQSSIPDRSEDHEATLKRRSETDDEEASTELFMRFENLIDSDGSGREAGSDETESSDSGVQHLGV